MTNTKSYLFAAVSSTFFIFLVLPPTTNSSPWLPTHIAVICVLSVLSISAGGLASEAYRIARESSVTKSSSKINANKYYFLAVLSSLLFLAVVAPSMQSYVEKQGIAGIATVIVLVILVIAVAGLVSEGILSLAKIRPITTTTRQTPDEASPSSLPSVTIDVLSHIDSSFKAFDSSQERRIRELKQQLVNALDRKNGHPIETNTSLEVKSNLGAAKESSSQKDRIVDTLLGKSSVGGAK
jgi:uncharacterized membrane protein